MAVQLRRLHTIPPLSEKACTTSLHFRVLAPLAGFRKLTTSAAKACNAHTAFSGAPVLAGYWPALPVCSVALSARHFQRHCQADRARLQTDRAGL
eukprot:1156529-Pelagomonas_calceolata.AAC.3